MEEIVVIQQSQGYIKCALEKLKLCLEALREKSEAITNDRKSDRDDNRKRLNLLWVIINIEKEFYLRVDGKLVEEFRNAVAQETRPEKIIYELMLKLYKNKDLKKADITNDLQRIYELFSTFNEETFKLVERLLYFALDFGYWNILT